MNSYWHIWSIEHGMWWRKSHQGYTEIQDEAGVYTYEEALKIVKNANIRMDDIPNEAMILSFEY